MGEVRRLERQVVEYFADVGGSDYDLTAEWYVGQEYIIIRNDIDRSVAVHVCVVDDLIEALTKLRTKYRSEQL